jgi:glycosyltransferase involved in cell wall biosynthesis
LSVVVPWLVARGREFKPTMIDAHGIHEEWTAAIAGRVLGVPTVVNWHGAPGHYSSKSWKRCHKASSLLGTSLICIDNCQLDEMRASGFRSDRMEVIPNGIFEPEFAEADQSSLRAELNLPEGELIVAAVSRIAPEKNLDRFVSALEICSKRNAAIRGVIVGDGDRSDRQQLEQRIERSGVDIKLVGWDPTPSRWIRASDIVAMTSDFETQPLALIEAMACSRPFVAMEAGGIRGLSNYGSSGTVVNAADIEGFVDALLNLASDSGARRRMGEAGRNLWTAKLQHRQMVDSYLDAFTKLGSRCES